MLPESLVHLPFLVSSDAESYSGKFRLLKSLWLVDYGFDFCFLFKFEYFVGCLVRICNCILLKTLLFIRWGKREKNDNWQTISNILLANQQHLELLCLKLLHLDISIDGLLMDRFLLPPNLKFLSVRHNNYDVLSMLLELTAEQCPKLCGLQYYGALTVRTINAISRFEKFVSHLNIRII